MEELDAFIDQFYGKYAPNDIPQGERRDRLKEKLRSDFDGYVGQMYSKYSPDNLPDETRLASLKSKYLAKQEAGVLDYAAAGVGAFNRGISQVVTAPLKVLGAVEETVGGVGYLSQAGQAIDEFVGNVNPRNENVNETYQGVAEGLGQAAGMIASAGTSGASGIAQTATKVPGVLPSLGKSLAAKPAVLGGTMTAAPEWGEAKQAGLSDEQAFEVLVKNYLVGQTEAIPISNLLNRINKLTGNSVLNTVKAMGVQGIEEGLQEGVQTYLTNQIAKEEYDPDRDPLFQVLQSAKVGGIVGLILPGAMSIAKSASADKRVKIERKLAEIQADEAIAEVGDTGDPSLNAQVDDIQIDPVDKQVLEEAKVAEAVQTEQKELETAEKLQEDLQKGTESTENAENTKTNTAEEAEIKPSQTPEYKIAVAKVEELQKKFAELPIDENADELLLELREARKSLQQIAGKHKDTRRKTDIQKQIEDTTGVTKPEKSVKMTANEAIKQQVQTFYKGMDKGVKKGKQLTNDLVGKVQEAVKEFPLTSQQTSQLLSKVKKTNLFTPGSVSKLNSFIDKVTTDAKYAEDLSVSESLRAKLKKKAKTKVESIPRPYKSVARDFARIKPENVSNLEEYQQIANEVLGGFADPKTPQYAPINLNDARSYVNRINTEQQARQVQDIRDEFGFGEEFTDEEIQAFAESENIDEEDFLLNKEDTKRKLVRDKILRTAEFTKLGLDDVQSEENKQVLDNLRKAPLDELSDGQLVEYVRTVDNIIENDDFSNTARIEAQIEAVNNAKKLLAELKGKKLGELGTIKGAVYNVPMMFNAIYSSSEIAAKIQLYSKLQDVYNGGSRVEGAEHTLYEDFQKEANRIKKKFGKSVLDAETQVKIGVFGHLVRYPKGADPDESFLKSLQVAAQSVERLKKKKDREELAKDAEKALQLFRNAKTMKEAFNIMKKDPAAYEMWEFFKNQFSTNVKSKLKQNTEQIFNEEFIEEENYTPRVLEVVDQSLTQDIAEDPWLASASRSDIGRPKQSKTALRSVNSIGSGRAINFEFYNNMFRKYRESMYDIETSKPRLQFREFMRLPAATEILGGIENKQRLTETYLKSEAVQRGIGRDYSDASRMMDELTGALRTLGYTAALGSVDQFVKQYIPVATNTMWNLGTDSGLFFGHIPEGTNKLFQMYTIGQRGRRLGGAERGESIKYKIQAQFRNKGLRLVNRFHTLTEKGSHIFMYSLTKGDVSVAQRSWAAYYMKYLKDKGVDLKTVNLANEHTLQTDPIRREAAAYAEQKVKETQVVSNPSELAKLLRTAPGVENWMKNIFIPFSTFAVNTKVRVIENIRQLRTNENKPEAYRALAGTMSEIMLYSTIKFYLLSLVYDALKEGVMDVFDLEGEDDEDKDAKTFRKWYSAIYKDFVPFSVGTMGENLSVEAANRIAYIFQNPDLSYQEWQKETKGGTFYAYKSTSQTLDLGLYSVGLERIQEFVKNIQTSFTGEATVSNYWGEKDVTLDPDQKRFVSFMTMLDFLSSGGFMDAGFYNALKQVQRKQMGEKSTNPSNRLQPKPRPRLRPQPQPAQILRPQ